MQEVPTQVNISSEFSRNSEANASEFLENSEEIDITEMGKANDGQIKVWTLSQQLSV